MSDVVFWDFETDPFGPSNLAPPPVCVSVATGPEKADTIVVAHCEPEFEDLVAFALENQSACTNTAFEASVVMAHMPRLKDKVLKAYNENRITDILIREKLRVLADTGDLSYGVLPNGAKMKLKFSQAELEFRLLGVDRSAEKDDDNGWRKNYFALRGIPAKEYPAEAYQYSFDDAYHGRQIHEIQESCEYLSAQYLNVRAALALQLSSCWGFPVDAEVVEQLIKELGAKCEDRCFPHLLQAGILRPSEPAQPYAKQLEKAVALLGRSPADWSAFVPELEAKGIKFKKPKASSINEGLLRAQVAKVCESAQLKPVLTDGGDISFNEEQMAQLGGLDPTVDEYIARAEVYKLVHTDLPRMRTTRVHPKYNPLITTGRTSSFGNRKDDKDPAYPAVNIQQVDPRIRHAFIATPGHVICSVDYNFIELVSAAQTCLDLLGYSTLATWINAGQDPHARLGSVLARRMAEPSEFWKPSDNNDTNYSNFLPTKKTDPKFYKLWRTLAKPTGLGNWGGYGAAKFVSVTKKPPYSIDLVTMFGGLEAALRVARELKAEWSAALPEANDYFNMIRRDFVDFDWSVGEEQRYCYTSPVGGMLRSNCVFTEAINGRALQTPTAEGAKISLWMLAEALYDDTIGSVLFGSRLLAFVHDEVLVEIPEDELMHERAMEVARIMRDGMSQVMTRVKVGAEPALMRRWNKAAEPVFGPDGRLKVWTPN